MNWEKYRERIGATGKIEEDWYILGIDLGTTNSVVSYWNSRTNQPEPIDLSSGFGKVPMPSIVQYRKEEDEWVIGTEADQTMKIYPTSTVTSIKRKMGSKEQISLGDRTYLPEEISGKILAALLAHVAALNPKSVLAGVVVSVPYGFDDAARKATIRACHLAGLEESLICLIEEPKAAALAYNFTHELMKDEKIMVFDFGGGTLDITVFHVLEKDATALYMKVLSEGGETYHGGDNIDATLYDHMLIWMEEKTGHLVDTLPLENRAELSKRAKETKERLSGMRKYKIPYTFCVPPFMQPLTREAFENMIQTFRDKTKKLILEVLKDGYAGPISKQAISRVLLEGGSSGMPWVKELLVEIFEEADKIYRTEKPALDIAIGATYYAAMKLGLLTHRELETVKQSVHFQVPVAHDIGLEIDGERGLIFYPMIGRGTPYPLAKQTMIFTLSGETEEDMTSLKLKLLERIKKGDTLDDCKLIGNVIISGLPRRPSGKTQIRLTLSMEEIGGTLQGHVEDIGYGDTYKASGFSQSFVPERHQVTAVGQQANDERSL